MDNEKQKEMPQVGIATVIKPRIDIEPPTVAPAPPLPTTDAVYNPFPNI